MTREEANKLILDHWTKEGLAKGWVEEHIKYNILKEENAELQETIDKAIEYNEHLIRDAKYHLNLGHLKKMKKILQGEDK